MFKSIKNIIVIIALIGVLVFAYIMFFGGDDTPALEGSLGSGRQSTIAANELLLQLQELQQIELNEAVFSDPLFQRLNDNTKQVDSEPVGRENPFAPI